MRVQPVLMREKTVAFLYAECAGTQGATPADLMYLRAADGASPGGLHPTEEKAGYIILVIPEDP
jgi:hypothetical protein